MFILVLCSLYLTLCNCASVEKVKQFYIWDDDPDWWRIPFTTKRPKYIWETWTDPPGSRHDYGSSSSNSGIVVVLGLIFILVLIIGGALTYSCKYCCKNSSSSSSSRINMSSNWGRNIVPPPRNLRQSTPQNTFSLTPPTQVQYNPLSHTSNWSSNTNNAVDSNTNNVVDGLPCYATVTLSDFETLETKYPAVKPTIPETPPPMYKENAMKY